VPAGEAFTARQADHIRHALATARTETGLWFSVYIGPIEGDLRGQAQRLHAALGDVADHAVLLLVEPEARRVEIVTGAAASRRVDDRTAALASLSMATSFAGGDLVGGIVNGIAMMAGSAIRPPVLHEHTAD
jgi:uncharacterized membrane protein YgcG